MMNPGVNSETPAPSTSSTQENQYTVDVNQGNTASYLPLTAGSESVLWSTHRVNNYSTENGVTSNSAYHPHQQIDPTKNVHSGMNAATLPSPSNTGTSNAQQDYNAYASYPNSTDPYGYGSTGYASYYSSHQQQPNYSYFQPVGSYQNAGAAPYQPLPSFQNTGSYAGPTSYSSTYYNPSDYQNTGGYPSSSYSNQNTLWNEGSYANYTSQQYPNYNQDSSGAYSSTSIPETSAHYQQQYNKQWADYYSQTEVTCAPGTEKLSVTSTSNQGCAVPTVNGGYPTTKNLPSPPLTGAYPTSCIPPPPPLTGGYPTSDHQPPPSFTSPWRPESNSSQMPPSQLVASSLTATHDAYWKQSAPSFQNNYASSVPPQFQKPVDSKPSYNSFQDQQKIVCPPPPNSQYPLALQVNQYYQLPLQADASSDIPRVNKLQIPTNPRIASNLPLGLPKADNRDNSATSAAAKPAYISVSFPKPDDKVFSHDVDASILKPGVFPKSLRGYVERALGRCKNDSQVVACQAVLKEMITKATSDGTLYTKDWDTEPLFPIPDADEVNKDLPSSVSSLPKCKRSPGRRSKSRWEPLQEEKSVDKQTSVSNDTIKYGGWFNAAARDIKVSMNSESKKNGFLNIKSPLLEKKAVNMTTQRPFKRQHLSDMLNTADNGDASSDSDKEQKLTAYTSAAIALSNSPEERKRRDNRSKRFEKVHGHREEINRFRPKNAKPGNLYARRENSLVLSKTFEDCGNRAVEDIDWDSLTVKGSCQEIEKRYLRLTSAPDPESVRPEEVLEKALLMVRNSSKNYLFKCDQLKSIRQDLTVQRIRNHLTVRVYETHARLALEVGDLPEYNQCQSQLKTLYAEGIEGSHMEFSAYHLLCVIMHSNNNRDLLSSMSRLSDRSKEDEAVKHALAVRAAVTSGNYVKFFRLFKTAPNLNSCLMFKYVEKMRYKAVTCMTRSYRPTLPVSYITRVLGFTSESATNEEHDECLDGLEDCVEWLKAHGACVIADNIGEMLLDTKASSSSLFMPEPEDAVAHGDASLAVNDFLARTPV